MPFVVRCSVADTFIDSNDHVAHELTKFRDSFIAILRHRHGAEFQVDAKRVGERPFPKWTGRSTRNSPRTPSGRLSPYNGRNREQGTGRCPRSRESGHCCTGRVGQERSSKYPRPVPVSGYSLFVSQTTCVGSIPITRSNTSTVHSERSPGCASTFCHPGVRRNAWHECTTGLMRQSASVEPAVGS